MSNRKWTVGLLAIFLVFCYFLVQFLSSTITIQSLIQQMQKSKADDQNVKHVVLISQELDNPYWRTMEKGAEEAAAKMGMKIEYTGPIRINPAEQLKLLEKSIAAKPDAVLVQGVKDRQYDLLIGKAIDQGIKVITVDTDAPDSRRLAYVGTDNREAGRRMGELVAQDSGWHGSIGVIIGSELAENQLQRLEGFRSVIDNTAGFQIVDVRSSNISRFQAAGQTEAMLSQYPEIRTIVGFSAWDAVGALEGMKVKNRADIRVFGFDDLGETKQAIAGGAIKASVVQRPREIGYASVSLLQQYFTGGSSPAKQYTTTEILDANRLKSGAVNR